MLDGPQRYLPAGEWPKCGHADLRTISRAAVDFFFFFPLFFLFFLLLFFDLFIIYFIPFTLALAQFAKMLRYVGLRTLCDAAFAGFMVSWFITRHILYNIVLWSCTFDCPRLIPYASADFSRGRYLNKPTHSAFVTLLVALQVILCIWFGMIVKVAWRVISGDGAVDSRSDEETTEDEYELDDAEEEKKRLKSAAAISG